MSKTYIKHGLSSTKAYKRKKEAQRRKEKPWESHFYHAKQRCTNPNNDQYHNYGGRGICFNITMKDVKALWLRDNAKNMKKPSLDRIDNDLDYTFDNCQFMEIGDNLRKRHQEIKELKKMISRCYQDKMFVYLAGLMSGEKLNETVSWRVKIRKHYENWKGRERYPISFLDPYNGPELSTIDKEGLKSDVSANAIIMGDYSSVKKADVIIANLNDFGSSRPSIGTHWELAWAWQMQKPFILIVPTNLRYRYENHPFTSRASMIVNSVEELLENKILNYFYKRINPANYKW
jgi:hypothetical protein